MVYYVIGTRSVVGHRDPRTYHDHNVCFLHIPLRLRWSLWVVCRVRLELLRPILDLLDPAKYLRMCLKWMQDPPP